MGHLSALWSSIIIVIIIIFFCRYFERIGQFLHLKQKYLIMHFIMWLALKVTMILFQKKKKKNSASSCCFFCIYFWKVLFPCDLVVDYQLDFQYNSCSSLHAAVGGTDLPILGSSFHLPWNLLCICSELVFVPLCLLGLIYKKQICFPSKTW